MVFWLNIARNGHFCHA